MNADSVIEVNCSKSRSLIIAAERPIMILTQLIALTEWFAAHAASAEKDVRV